MWDFSILIVFLFIVPGRLAVVVACGKIPEACSIGRSRGPGSKAAHTVAVPGRKHML